RQIVPDYVPGNIIREYDTGNAVPRGKRGYVATQEVPHPGVQEEAQEDLPRMAQHHDERHQWTPRPADLEMAEMSPVHLCLFAGQATKRNYASACGRGRWQAIRWRK